MQTSLSSPRKTWSFPLAILRGLSTSAWYRAISLLYKRQEFAVLRRWLEMLLKNIGQTSERINQLNTRFTSLTSFELNWMVSPTGSFEFYAPSKLLIKTSHSIFYGMSVVFLCLLMAGPGAHAQTLTWQNQYDGPHHGDDMGNRIKNDGSGNVYVAGTSEDDIVLIKYNAAGVQQWVARYDSIFTNEANAPVHAKDYLYDLEVDASGNAYLTILSLYGYNNCEKKLVTTLKYNFAGARQWKSELALYCGNPANPVSSSFSATDGAGNFYRSVSYYNSSQYTLLLQKLSPAGVEVWKIISQGDEYSARVFGLDVNAAGNINLISRHFVFRYNQAGNLQWQNQLTGFTPIHEVKSDVSGNVYITNGGSLVKYNAAGVKQWQVNASQEANQLKEFGKLLVDATGNIYATGLFYTNNQSFVRKYNSQGIQQWETMVGSAWSDEATPSYPLLEMDAAQNLYVALSAFYPLESLENSFHTSLEKVTPMGTEVWTITNLTSLADLCVDAPGNAYLMSIIVGDPKNSTYDILTQKYAAPAAPACQATGSILRELWSNVPGHSINNIPVNTPPTSTDQLTIFRTRASVADNYGQRLRGYICPPTTGSYTFFIQGDDVAELYLSTDDNPDHKQRIASAKVAWGWTQQASQRSAPINLVAGKRYYVEALHKEAVGGDMVRVGWRTPTMAASAEPVVIPGSVLSPFVPTTPQPVNGLLACYSFSGNAQDGSNQANHGTVNGATLTTDRFGKANSAYAFNGVSDYISIPSASLHNNTYSYSLWVKVTALPSVGSATFPLSIGGDGGDQAIGLANQYVASIYKGWTGGGYNTSGVSNFYNVGSLPALNSWYHLAVTRSLSTVSVYVNGQLAGTVSTDGLPAAYNGNNAIIGARYNLTQLFQGAIDDIQIYNIALTATEIKALYQQTGNACSESPTARLSQTAAEGMLSTLKAYPNPTTGIATVAFTAAETGWLGVQLYNLQGQPLQQLFGQQVETGSVHQQPLDVTALPSGLYLIRMVNGKHVESHKLLVGH